MKMHSEQKSQKLQEGSIQLSTNPSAPLPNPLSQGDSPHTVIMTQDVFGPHTASCL